MKERWCSSSRSPSIVILLLAHSFDARILRNEIDFSIEKEHDKPFEAFKDRNVSVLAYIGFAEKFGDM